MTKRERQTKMRSLVETTAQLTLGFFVSLAVWNWVVGPALGHEANVERAFWITVVFTVSSFIRHYLVRRGFERWG